MSLEQDLPDEKILAGLRKAASSGPLPLVSKGGRTPVVGIFPTGGGALAENAKSRGWLEEKKENRSVETTSRGRTRVTVKEVSLGWVLTADGYAYLARQDSPKAALEALAPAVQRLASSPSNDPEKLRSQLAAATASISELIRQELAKVAEACEKSIQTAFAKLTPTDSGTVRADAVLDAVRVAAGRVSAPPAVESKPTPPELVSETKRDAVQPPPETDRRGQLEKEIVSFVDKHAAETTVGCHLDVLMKALKTTIPGVSIGEFHDALRRLDDARRIKLGFWSKSIHDLPEPELALFVAHKVIYYAHPAR